MYYFRSFAKWLDQHDWPLFKQISPVTKRRWLRRIARWIPSTYNRDVVQVGDLRLAMPWSSWDRAVFVEKQRAITDCLKRWLRPGMRVVDVGANIGYISVVSAKLVGLTGCVYAVEPFPGNVSVLRSNVELNALTNVRILPIAAGERRETRILYVREDHTSISLYAQHNKPITGETFEVDVARLDHLVPPPVDLVKIDVEGAELEVLAGLAGFLTEPHPPIMIVEWNPVLQQKVGHHPGTLPKYLMELGYRLFDLEGTQELMVDINDIDLMIDKLRAAAYPARDLLALPPHVITQP